MDERFYQKLARRMIAVMDNAAKVSNMTRNEYAEALGKNLDEFARKKDWVTDQAPNRGEQMTMQFNERNDAPALQEAAIQTHMQTLERLKKENGANYAYHVAVGSVTGAVFWLLHHYGKDETYELLCDRANKVKTLWNRGER